MMALETLTCCNLALHSLSVVKKSYFCRVKLSQGLSWTEQSYRATCRSTERNCSKYGARCDLAGGLEVIQLSHQRRSVCCAGRNTLGVRCREPGVCRDLRKPL